jgi:hypothetical protein
MDPEGRVMRLPRELKVFAEAGYMVEKNRFGMSCPECGAILEKSDITFLRPFCCGACGTKLHVPRDRANRMSVLGGVLALAVLVVWRPGMFWSHVLFLPLTAFIGILADIALLEIKPPKLERYFGPGLGLK